MTTPTPKVEVTDAINAEILASYRRIIDAALNPPPEPEIAVSRQMADIGGKIYRECRDDERAASRQMTGWSTNDFAQKIYTAMEAQRRMETELWQPPQRKETPHRHIWNSCAAGGGGSTEKRSASYERFKCSCGATKRVTEEINLP